mmetsp:Transcript_1595/g.4636  ORF Transcript_1595/g.4636 Transcript_1595/m.4636 type:complete len:251 (-) Transcript_1595:338-1090(-)
MRGKGRTDRWSLGGGGSCRGLGRCGRGHQSWWVVGEYQVRYLVDWLRIVVGAAALEPDDLDIVHRRPFGLVGNKVSDGNDDIPPLVSDKLPSINIGAGENDVIGRVLWPAFGETDSWLASCTIMARDSGLEGEVRIRRKVGLRSDGALIVAGLDALPGIILLHAAELKTAAVPFGGNYLEIVGSTRDGRCLRHQTAHGLSLTLGDGVVDRAEDEAVGCGWGGCRCWSYRAGRGHRGHGGRRQCSGRTSRR